MKQKRILPFLLAAALLLGLAGCGGDSSDSSSLPEEEPEKHKRISALVQQNRKIWNIRFPSETRPSPPDRKRLFLFPRR